MASLSVPAVPGASFTVTNFHNLPPTSGKVSLKGRKFLKGPTFRREVYYELICTITKANIQLVGYVRESGSPKQVRQDNEPKGRLAEIHFSNQKLPLGYEKIVPKFLQHADDFTVIVEEPQGVVGLPYKITIMNNCEFSLLTVSEQAPIFRPRQKPSVHFYNFETARELAIVARKDHSDQVSKTLQTMAQAFLMITLATPNDIKEILDIFPALNGPQKVAVMQKITTLLGTSLSIDQVHLKALGEIFTHFQKFTTPGEISVEPNAVEISVDKFVNAQTQCLDTCKANQLSPKVFINIIERLMEKLSDSTTPYFAGGNKKEDLREAYEETIQQLRTLSCLLELLVKAKMTQIPREKVQEPLLEILGNYQHHTDPKIAFLYEYCIYLLTLIENDEKSWHAFLRYSSYIAVAVINVAKIYSQKDINSIKETLHHAKAGFSGVYKTFTDEAPKVIDFVTKAVEKGVEAKEKIDKIKRPTVLSTWPTFYFALRQGVLDGNEIPVLRGLNDLLKNAEKTLPDNATEKEKLAQDEARKLLEEYPTHNPFFVSGLVEILGDLLIRSSLSEIEERELEKEGKKEKLFLDLLQRIFTDNLPGVKGYFRIDHSIVSSFQNVIKIGKEYVKSGISEGATDYKYLLGDVFSCFAYCTVHHPVPEIRYRAEHILRSCYQAAKVGQSQGKSAAYIPSIPQNLDYTPPIRTGTGALLDGALTTTAPERDGLMMLRRAIEYDPILTEHESNYVPLKVNTLSKSKQFFKDFIYQFLNPPLSQKRQERVLLVTGQLGSGKSFTVRKIAKELWEEYKQGDYIPIIIHLPRFIPMAQAIEKFLGFHGINDDRKHLVKLPIAWFFESLDEVGGLTSSIIAQNQDLQGRWKFVILSRSIRDEEKQFLYPKQGSDAFTEVSLSGFDEYQKRAGWQKHNETARMRNETDFMEVEEILKEEEKSSALRELTQKPLFHHVAALTLPRIIKESKAYTEESFMERFFSLNYHREVKAQAAALEGLRIEAMVHDKKRFVDYNIRIHECFDPYINSEEKEPNPKIPEEDLKPNKQGKFPFADKWIKAGKPILSEVELKDRIAQLTDIEGINYFYRRCCPINVRDDHIQYINRAFWVYIQGLREDPNTKISHLISVITNNQDGFGIAGPKPTT